MDSFRFLIYEHEKNPEDLDDCTDEMTFVLTTGQSRPSTTSLWQTHPDSHYYVKWSLLFLLWAAAHISKVMQWKHKSHIIIWHQEDKLQATPVFKCRILTMWGQWWSDGSDAEALHKNQATVHEADAWKF